MRRILCAAFAALALCACNDSTGIPGLSGGRASVVVLNGVGETGVTLVPFDGASSAHIDFGAAFDGAVFTVQNDTVLSTSSSFGGDQLYVADLVARTLRRTQLPAGSNPAGAAFFPGGTAGALARQVVVALRNTGQLAVVELTDPALVTTFDGAGTCPADVIFHNGEIWAVDENLACDSDFSTLGTGRLIRVPLDGSAADTIDLGPLSVSAQRAVVRSGVAFILSGGDFASTPGAVSRVDLTTQQVTATLPLPAGVFGVDLSLGKDGRLYVTAAGTPFVPHVYIVDPATMAFVRPGPASDGHIVLVREDGSEASCFAATADAQGNIYCVDNGDVTATVLRFGPSGTFADSAAAGSLGFDIAIR